MKTLITLLFFIGGVFIGCSDNDIIVNPPPVSHTILRFEIADVNAEILVSEYATGKDSVSFETITQGMHTVGGYLNGNGTAKIDIETHHIDVNGSFDTTIFLLPGRYTVRWDITD